MKYSIALTGLILAGCTTNPPPLCDREAVEWDKWGTSELAPECSPRPKPRPVTLTGGNGDGPGLDHDAGTDAAPDEPDGGVDPVPDDSGPDRPPHPDKPEKPDEPEVIGNPGNDKPVGRAGENPNRKGGWGSGSRGMGW